jgi:prophage antirepressor-like protein
MAILLWHEGQHIIIIGMDDPSYIVKAFKNTQITITRQEDTNFLFRASEVAKVVGITNIYRKIQKYDVPLEKLPQNATHLVTLKTLFF